MNAPNEPPWVPIKFVRLAELLSQSRAPAQRWLLYSVERPKNHRRMELKNPHGVRFDFRMQRGTFLRRVAQKPPPDNPAETQSGTGLTQTRIGVTHSEPKKTHAC